MNEININDIPMLDCREKENVKYLIKMFNNIKPVKSNELSYKDFKNDIERFTSLMHRILDKKHYALSGISYWNHKQSVFVSRNEQYGKTEAHIASKTLNELYLKVCVFCYYNK